MTCQFCGAERDREKVDGKAKAYICSACVQTLMNLSQEQLKKAHALAVDRGYENKARVIESFLEVQIYGTKTKDTKRNMVRTRPSRTARPSRYRFGAQSAAL